MYCRLLILDDESKTLDALRRELMREPTIGTEGVEVETFSLPSDALARITQSDGDFDAAIVDYRMPQMDGIAFLDLLRARRPATIRILLTGMIDLAGALEAINTAQVHHLVTKPWHEYDLKGRIALALREREICARTSAVLGGGGGHEQPLRLLLVDDEPSVLNALVREISMHGLLTRGRQPLFDIATADSAAKALQTAGEHCPDIVISDYAMPGMDGIELLHRIRDACPRCVRILMSGRSDLGVLTEAINVAGVYHFVGKPWEAAQLRAVVHEALSYMRLPAP